MDVYLRWLTANAEVAALMALGRGIMFVIGMPQLLDVDVARAQCFALFCEH